MKCFKNATVYVYGEGLKKRTLYFDERIEAISLFGFKKAEVIERIKGMQADHKTVIKGILQLNKVEATDKAAHSSDDKRLKVDPNKARSSVSIDLGYMEIIHRFRITSLNS